MNRSTREIERDVERTRSDIEDTVEALRDKMSFGQIVDEASHYLRNSGGSEALSNLAAQARANPLPLALVGIGLAWLMSGRGQPAMGYSSGTYGAYSGNGSHRDMGSRVGDTAGSAKSAIADTGRRAGEAVSSRLQQTGDAASQTYKRVSDTASQTYNRVSDTASQTYGRVSDTASHTYGRISDRASHTYDRVSERAGQAQRSMAEAIDSEPLILVGLGVAVGAAIGAMMPATRAEQRLMGDRLEEMKHDASEMAREEWEKTKAVAKDAAYAAKAEIEKGGSTAETTERAAKSASQTAQKSASNKGLGSSVRKD